MQCASCKTEMAKKGLFQSGNSKYQQWQCGACRKEKTEALGLIGGMPKHMAGYGT